MASYVPAKYGAEYILYVGLESVATAGAFQANPTLASGDVKISKDGGSLTNLATLPTVTPASGKMVKVTVSATEMQSENATIVFSDASGGEWKDLIINIQTAARQIDDLAYPTTTGRSIDVSAGGEVGIDWANIGSPTTTVNLSGTTAGLIDGAITAAKIGSDAITAAKIADGAIDAATFAAGAITSAAIASDAITDAKVASDVTIASVTAGVSLVDGAITAAKFGAGAITASVIATDAIDADAIAADAVTELQGGLATSTALATLTGYVDTEVAAIKAKTDNLPASPASEATLTTIAGYIDTEIAAILAAVDTEVGAIKAVTDNLPNGGALTTITNDVANILADTGTDGVVVASLGTQAKADVNAEVLDVLNVDTFAEPTSAPAATSSLRAKIGWLFKLARNKMTQTSTTQTLYADDGTTADNTSTTSDNGSVFSRGEWS